MTGVRTLLLYVAIVSAAVLLIGTAIGFLLARNVTNPIAASINALKRVSEGDLSVSMPPDMLSRGDEAGDLSSRHTGHGRQPEDPDRADYARSRDPRIVLPRR